MMIVANRKHVMSIDPDVLIIHAPQDIAEDVRRQAVMELRALPRICEPLLRCYRRIETEDGRRFVAEAEDGLELRGTLHQVLRGLFSLSASRSGTVRRPLLPEFADLRDAYIPDGWVRDEEIDNFCCFRARRGDLCADVARIGAQIVHVTLWDRRGEKMSTLYAEKEILSFILENAEEILSRHIDVEEGYVCVIEHNGAEAFCHISDLDQALKAIIAAR
jgi:hypothetical protein